MVNSTNIHTNIYSCTRLASSSTSSMEIQLSPLYNSMMITISCTSIGIVGTSISVILVVITTWRLIVHYTGHSCPCGQSGSDQPRIVEGWTLKRGMHEALWVSMISDLTAYVTVLGGRELSGLYLLQTVGRSLFEWWAMSLVTISWLQLMAGARAGLSERKIVFKIYPALLVCLGIALAVFSVQAGVNLFVDGELKVPVRYITITEAVAWGVHGISALHGSFMRYRRLINLPQWQSMKRRHRYCIAGNWFIVMGLTAFFFLLRSVVFASSIIFQWEDNTLTYWICGVWLPTFIPSLLYLYLLRRRDRVMGWIEGISDASLLMPSAPPEEAFQAFRNNLIDWENDNPGAEEEYRFNSKLNESYSSFIGYIYDSANDIDTEDVLSSTHF